MITKMKNFGGKPEEVAAAITTFLLAENEKYDELTFIDGASYYEGCAVGLLFYYFNDNKECLELPSLIVEKILSGELVLKYKTVARLALDGDSNYPLKRI